MHPGPIYLCLALILTDCPFLWGQPVIVQQDTRLTELAPAEAFDGMGSWTRGDLYFATGFSQPVDSLGEVKGRRTELEWAELSSKAGIAREAARSQDANFDEDAFEVTYDLKGFQVAAVYRFTGKEGLYLVGTVRSNSIKIQSAFNMGKVRQNAQAAFAAADFPKAAKLYAALTQYGAQDAETMVRAHVASAHINLDSGITGTRRLDNLKTLSDYYFKQKDEEKALKFTYEVYQATPGPERALLERLVTLSTQTNRSNNATAFQKEIERRWPKLSSP